MGTLTREELQPIADWYNNTSAPNYCGELPVVIRRVYDTRYYGRVYSKARPRVNKSGHAFTAKTTREFEKALRFHYNAAEVHTCPLTAVVVIYDTTPKGKTPLEKLLAAKGLIFSSIGDIDNKVKSILDAANGILFADDSQIICITVRREYHKEQGFSLTLFRAGLSSVEVHNLGNLIK